MAFAAYANSLGNGFVWDDPIVLNRQLVAFRSLSDVLFTPRGIPQYSPDYYRPVIMASYLLDRALGDHQPLMFHLSAVFLHAVVAALVCGLGLQVLGGGPAGVAGAVAAGALFAAHPIHTESVAWIAGRSDVLATAFVLAAMIVHGRAGPSWGASAATGALVLAALGAKENAVTVLPLLVLYDLLGPERSVAPSARPEAPPSLGGVSKGERRRDRWPPEARAWRRAGVSLVTRRYAGPAGAAVVYLLLRRAALGDVVGHAAGGAAVERSVADVVGAIGVYLSRLVWPVSLNAYIDAVPTGAAVLALTGLAIAGAIILGVWWWSRRRGVPVLLLSWVPLTLGPSLTIVWRIPDAPIAERYLYLPSVGLCLLLGAGVARLWAAKHAAVARGAIALGVALIVTIASVGTVRRNAVWRDDVTLWEDTASKSRTSGLPIRSLGTAYQQRGRVDDARRCFEMALERRNGPSGVQIAYNNLGTLAMQAKDFDRAETYYRQALQANPSAPDTVFNLGLATLQAGGAGLAAANAALPLFLRAQELSPHDPDVQAALGQVFAARGERERAVEHLRRALQMGASPATAASINAYLASLEQR